MCKTLDLKPDETSYIDIMHRLVKRYLFKLERAKDDTGTYITTNLVIGGVGGGGNGVMSIKKECDVGNERTRSWCLL